MTSKVNGFYAQVPMHRMAVEHYNYEEQNFKPTEGLRNHVETRLWSLVRTVEGAAKTTLSGLAFVVTAIAGYVFASAADQAKLLKDVTETQFHSFWRCALAIYSPDKALATMSDGKDWRLGGEKQQKAWGTEYDPEKTTTAEKLFAWKQPVSARGPTTA